MNYAEKFPSFKIEINDGIALVKFNHPERRNAFGETMHREVEEIFPALAEDPAVRVVVITGEGKAFSAGGNIKNMLARFGTEEGWQHAVSSPARVKRLVENIINCQLPTIAAINGDAMGLGATIALCCDIQVMGDTAHIGDTHVKAGLVAGDGGTILWPLLIGPSRAKDHLMRGKVLNGVEAEKLNLVNYCVPSEEVLTQAMQIAAELSALPPLAVRWTKVAVNKMLKAQFALMADASIAYEDLTLMSQDHREALQAMVDKRKPEFKGY